MTTAKELIQHLKHFDPDTVIVLSAWENNMALYSPNVTPIANEGFPFFQTHKCAVINIGGSFFTEEQLFGKVATAPKRRKK